MILFKLLQCKSHCKICKYINTVQYYRPSLKCNTQFYKIYNRVFLLHFYSEKGWKLTPGLCDKNPYDFDNKQQQEKKCFVCPYNSANHTAFERPI